MLASNVCCRDDDAEAEEEDPGDGEDKPKALLAVELNAPLRPAEDDLTGVPLILLYVDGISRYEQFTEGAKHQYNRGSSYKVKRHWSFFVRSSNTFFWASSRTFLLL